MNENREFITRFQEQANELKGLEKELFYKHLIGFILMDIASNKDQDVTDTHIYNIERALENTERISEKREKR